MRKTWITALAWILIAAVPVQGYAAALMVNCGPQHHGSTGQSGHIADLEVRHAHASNASGHAHDHTLMVVTSQPESQQSPAFDPSTTLSCSACAACCIGIALTVTVILPPSAAPLLAPRVEAVYPAIDAIVSGPERPPRLVLV